MMMLAKTRIQLVAVLLPAMVCALAGCESSQSNSQDLRLIASARPFERDVPIPVGFGLVDAASEDRSTGVSRLYLRHLYRGKGDPFAVRNFYREQMPLARWVKVSDGNVRGQITLRFEKNNESCTIDIRKVPSRGHPCVEVQVLISQEQRGRDAADAARKRNRK